MTALVLALALWLAPASADPDIEPAAAPAVAGTGVSVRRASLMVSDLDAARRIYGDVLGFDLARISALPADSSAYAVFGAPEGTALRFAALDTAGVAGALGLLEVRGAPLPAGGRTVIVLNAGDRFDAIRAGLTALNLDLSEVFVLGEGREMAFTDFDGNRIYLFETR
jgi:catechol 2,3-dioxygenase-like lactoylglutathione lyase family enzyme